MIHVHEYWELNNIIAFENSFHPQRIRQQIKNKFMKQQWEKSNWIVYFFLTHIFREATASKAQFMILQAYLEQTHFQVEFWKCGLQTFQSLLLSFSTLKSPLNVSCSFFCKPVSMQHCELYSHSKWSQEISSSLHVLLDPAFQMAYLGVHSVRVRTSASTTPACRSFNVILSIVLTCQRTTAVALATVFSAFIEPSAQHRVVQTAICPLTPFLGNQGD